MVGAKIGNQYLKSAGRIYLCLIYCTRITITHLSDHGVDS
jgi:hypothetical protein